MCFLVYNLTDVFADQAWDTPRRGVVSHWQMGSGFVDSFTEGYEIVVEEAVVEGT